MCVFINSDPYVCMVNSKEKWLCQMVDINITNIKIQSRKTPSFNSYQQYSPPTLPILISMQSLASCTNVKGEK